VKLYGIGGEGRSAKASDYAAAGKSHVAFLVRGTCHNDGRGKTNLACAVCKKRKEKRFCPAIHGRICAQCCGEQREVTIECPSDCPYLLQAREHEKPRFLEDLDQATLFRAVEIGDQFLYDHEHLLVGLSFALAQALRKDRSVRDTDLLSALTTLIRSYETLVNSGLHYETAMTGAQHGVANEVHATVKQYRATEEKQLGYSRLRDVDILRALVFLLRMGYARTSGRPKSRAYADFVLSQFPENQSTIATAGDVGGRIIVP
jgi:hypothetical protein